MAATASPAASDAGVPNLRQVAARETSVMRKPTFALPPMIASRHPRFLDHWNGEPSRSEFVKLLSEALTFGTVDLAPSASGSFRDPL
ncbi:hypothetical protein AB4059_10025 [Lysobacter sp. 2RAF19]